MPDRASRRISVLYFAAVKERVGVAQEELDLPADVATVRALAAWLEAERPGLRGALHAVRFAVAETFVELDHVLVAGDVVAVLPPVSGG
jgi:molybdopterin converting factor subunit 1